MKKKLIKKYKEGKNVTWDSSKYPLYKELPLRNYYWAPILDDTELTDYATGQPLKPGDAVLIDPRTGKPLSPNSNEAIRDYLTLTNLFEGLANLPDMTVIYNKDTGATTTKVGKLYDDYLEENNNAPVATSAQWEELAVLNSEANDLIRLELEKRAADRRTRNLTPGVGSLALLGAVGGMAAWNPLAFMTSLGGAKIGETTVDYPFLQQGYKSFGDWLFQGINAPEWLKLNSNPGTYLGGGFGYNLANLYLKAIELSATKTGIRKGFLDAAAEFLNSKQPYIVNDVEAIELGSRPLIKPRKPGIFYSKTGEVNKGSFIPRIKETVSSLFKQDPVWNLMEKVGIPEELRVMVKGTIFGPKISKGAKTWTDPMTNVAYEISNPGVTDEVLILEFVGGLRDAYKQFRSPEYKLLVLKEMSWDDSTYQKFLKELSDYQRLPFSVEVVGTDELGYCYAIVKHKSDGTKLYLINRDRIGTGLKPGQTVLLRVREAGLHEGYHGSTGGNDGRNGMRYIMSGDMKKHPLITDMETHNSDLLDDAADYQEWILYFLNTPKQQIVADLRLAGVNEDQIAYALEIGIPRAIKYNKYVMSTQETTARDFTSKFFPGWSENKAQLQGIYTPESFNLFHGKLLSTVGDINEGSVLGNWTIRALTSGNPLEKRINPQGLISRKNIEWYLKQSNVSNAEKTIMRLALESFSEDLNIPYTSFIQKVQELLPKFKTKNEDKFVNYGLGRLGYSEATLQPDGAGGLVDTFIPDGTHRYAFSLLSPLGFNNRHYNNANGHLRFFTNLSDPGVLYFIENLSDWAQLGLKNNAFTKGSIEEYAAKHYLDRLLLLMMLIAKQNGYNKIRVPVEATAAKIENFRAKNLLGKTLDIEIKYNQKANRWVSEKHPEFIELSEAEHNAFNKLQTAELNFSIYKKNLGDKYNFDGALYKTYQDIITDYDIASKLSNEEISLLKLLEGLIKSASEEREKIRAVYDKTRSSLMDDPYYQQLQAQKKVELELMLKSSTPVYSPEHQRILDKYKKFPEQVKNIFGNKTEVKLVTDAKNNLWYELDIPLDMNTRSLIFSKVGEFNTGSLTSAFQKAWQNLNNGSK